MATTTLMLALVVAIVVVLAIAVAVLKGNSSARAPRHSEETITVLCAGKVCGPRRMEVIQVLRPGPRMIDVANDPILKMLRNGGRGCVKCARCGNFFCYDCSDMDKACPCGAQQWLEGVYLDRGQG